MLAKCYSSSTLEYINRISHQFQCIVTQHSIFRPHRETPGRKPCTWLIYTKVYHWSRCDLTLEVQSRDARSRQGFPHLTLSNLQNPSRPFECYRMPIAYYTHVLLIICVSNFLDILAGPIGQSVAWYGEIIDQASSGLALAGWSGINNINLSHRSSRRRFQILPAFHLWV